MDVEEVPEGDVGAAGLLRRQRRALRRLRSRLAEDVGDLDRQIVELDWAIARMEARPQGDPIGARSTGSVGGDVLPPARVTRRPLRVMVLDALEDLAWPATSRDLVGYLEARVGRRVSSTRFGTLGSDEAAAFERTGGGRPVWLCFGIDIASGKPIKHLWGRSDWPLKHRLVAASTGRVQHLKMTARLCDLAQRPTAGMTHPERLLQLAAAYALDLPNTEPPAGGVNSAHLGEWRKIAQDLLLELEPRDDEVRTQAAWQLRTQGDIQLLFGPVDPVLRSAERDPEWRSTQSRPDPHDDTSGEPSRRRAFAQLLPELIAQLSYDGAVNLSSLYEAIENQFPGLVGDEVDGDDKPQWKHDLRWELETLVGNGSVLRRRDLGRGWYSPNS